MWYTKHKSLSQALLLIVLILGLISFVIMPVVNNITALRGKLKLAKDEYSVLTNKVSIVSSLDPEQLKQRVLLLDSALPPKNDVLLYLSSIDGLSRELGLNFAGITLSPGSINAPKVGLQSLETEIKVQGTQDNIYTFLRTIESVLPLMQIKNIKVSILDNSLSLDLTLGMLWADKSSTNLKGVVTLFDEKEEKYFADLSNYRKFNTISLDQLPTIESGKDNLFQSAIPQQ